jgi:L-seryl-tRNA(Ser) seleniumtransferase
MAEISGEFVSLEDLHKKAGEHLARLLGVEAAMVTSGAAAGLTLATAACMVGDDFALASSLPAPPPKHKVIIQCCHRNPFERAIQMAGATLVQVGDAIRTRQVDLESAFSDDVAAVVTFMQAEMLDASLSLSDTLEIAHAHNVPVIVDAAAELPPKSNLWKLAEKGADLVIFSGSKDLRGPQTSGLMVGRSDLIASAMRQSAPHEHVIGRPMKAGKGIVIGMLTAVELYLAEDESSRFAEWEKIATYIEAGLSEIPGLQARRFTPDQPYIQPATVPRLAVTLLDEGPLTLSDLKIALWEGDPPIAVEVAGEVLWINTHTLTMGEAEIIVQRMVEICSIN